MPKPPASSSPVLMPNPKVWAAILRLAIEGQSCEKQIADLEVARADIKGKLAEMGLGTTTKQTAEWKNLAAAYAEIDLTLASERSDLKNLARKSNSLITGAAQGKLFDDGEVDSILADDGHAPLPLYEDAMRSAQALGVVPNVGESDEAAAAREPAKGDPLGVVVVKPARPAKPAETGWAGIKISEVDGMTLGDARALEEVGLLTLGDVDRFVNVDKLKLTTIDGLSARERKVLTETIIRLKNAETAKSAATAGDSAPPVKAPKGRKPAAA